MNIGTIGSGRMANGLTRLWAKAGHHLLIGSRDAGKAQSVADAARRATGGSITGGTYTDAVHFSEVLLLATPWSATREVIAALPPLREKMIVECTNYFGPDTGEGATTEQIARWTHGARVVKAFNTLFFDLLERETLDDRPTVFMAGDDMPAKAIVSQLILDARCEPVDAGPLAAARYLDALGQFIVHLGMMRGMGRGISYKLIHL